MPRLPRFAPAALALFGALASASGSAHVTLAERTVPAGGYARLTLQVPHGCSGRATTGVAVELPAGLASVKPMPKPGWTLQVKKGKYEKSYKLYGEDVTSGVKEVDWSGGSLPDEFYDEFVFRGTLAADLPAGQKIYFPVVQECEGATTRWIEIPAAGQDEDALEDPAPGLNLLPKK